MELEKKFLVSVEASIGVAAINSLIDPKRKIFFFIMTFLRYQIIS